MGEEARRKWEEETEGNHNDDIYMWGENNLFPIKGKISKKERAQESHIDAKTHTSSYTIPKTTKKELIYTYAHTYILTHMYLLTGNMILIKQQSIFNHILQNL